MTWADCEAELTGLVDAPGPKPLLECRMCGRLLPLDAFYRRTQTKRGRELDCKECR